MEIRDSRPYSMQLFKSSPVAPRALAIGGIRKKLIMASKIPNIIVT